ILGASLDATVQGLRAMSRLHVDRLPRMADFMIWASACETGLWPAGTFARAYAENRKSAIEDIIDADPVGTWVRAIMAERSTWTGTAAGLLRAGAVYSADSGSIHQTGWPQNPRALAGRLRRAQTYLRTMGINISFIREGHAGTRMIKISKLGEKTARTVSI